MDDLRWPIEKVNAWYDKQPWLVGCNFIPSTAINQIEMWQTETFDIETIRRELGWASDLGFNSVRVFLHDLVWYGDPVGLKKKINLFLDCATRYNLRVVFVLLDDCWNSDPVLGPQPAPKPGIHNSGWVQSPGLRLLNSPHSWNRIQDYIEDIISTYRTDERILMWDIYNEPGNLFFAAMKVTGIRRLFKVVSLLISHYLFPLPTTPLLHKAFKWARSCQPEQPLTSPLWFLLPPLASKLNKQLLALSDVITFHDYSREENTVKLINQLRLHNRPLICTEYMARTYGNLFSTHLPLYKREKIGCFNWGFVNGKTQTIYAWDKGGQTKEPEVWFHDILRKDGTPYDIKEIELINQLTGKSNTKSA